MNLFYSSRKLERILENPTLVAKHYGRLSGSLNNRLSELRAAQCLADVPAVPPPRRHKVSENIWALDISRNYRLLLEPVNPCNLNDLRNVTSVRVLDIVDYH